VLTEIDKDLIIIISPLPNVDVLVLTNDSLTIVRELLKLASLESQLVRDDLRLSALGSFVDSNRVHSLTISRKGHAQLMVLELCFDSGHGSNALPVMKDGRLEILHLEVIGRDELGKVKEAGLVSLWIEDTELSLSLECSELDNLFLCNGMETRDDHITALDIGQVKLNGGVSIELSIRHIVTLAKNEHFVRITLFSKRLGVFEPLSSALPLKSVLLCTVETKLLADCDENILDRTSEIDDDGFRSFISSLHGDNLVAFAEKQFIVSAEIVLIEGDVGLEPHTSRFEGHLRGLGFLLLLLSSEEASART